MRDASTPALVLVLGVASAPAFGALPAGFLPSDPLGALALVLFVLAAWVAVVLPSVEGAGPARALEAFAVGAPFVAALVAATPGGAPLPIPALLAALAVGALAAALGDPWRVRLGAIAASALAAPALVAGLGVAAPSAGLRPTAAPVETTSPGEAVRAEDLVPAAWRGDDGAATRRAGALARTPSAGPAREGRPPLDAAYTPVPPEARAALPVAGPVVLVVGSGPLDLRSSSGSRGEPAVVTTTAFPRRALDLDAIDALVFLAADGDLDADSADAVASFARRGGLLVGPMHPATWPEALARRLGAAVVVEAPGVDGARQLGAGRVARAAGAADVLDLLAAGFSDPRVGTVFDRATASPTAPPEFPRWKDDPAARRDALPLLVLFGVVVSVAGLLRGAKRAAGVALLSGLAVFGARVSAAPAEDALVTPFLLDIGGLGGRRVEGLHVEAGPRGFVVPRGARSDAGLRALGFLVRRVDGDLRLVLPAGQGGWIVEESVARGEAEGAEPAERVPTWAERLLRWSGGGSEGSRVAAGEGPYGGPRPGGLGEGRRAWIAVLSPKRP